MFKKINMGQCAKWQNWSKNIWYPQAFITLSSYVKTTIIQSKINFQKQCCGSRSRIRCFLPPGSGNRIRDKFFPDANSGSGMNYFFDYGDLLLKPQGARQKLVSMLCPKNSMSPFLCKIRDLGWKNFRIWDEKIFGPDKTSRIRNTDSQIL
jgi:hypothetical protein